MNRIKETLLLNLCCSIAFTVAIQSVIGGSVSAEEPCIGCTDEGCTSYRPVEGCPSGSPCEGPGWYSSKKLSFLERQILRVKKKSYDHYLIYHRIHKKFHFQIRSPFYSPTYGYHETCWGKMPSSCRPCHAPWETSPVIHEGDQQTNEPKPDSQVPPTPVIESRVRIEEPKSMPIDNDDQAFQESKTVPEIAKPVSMSVMKNSAKSTVKIRAEKSDGWIPFNAN